VYICTVFMQWSIWINKSSLGTTTYICKVISERSDLHCRGNEFVVLRKNICSARRDTWSQSYDFAIYDYNASVVVG
jgi:hypothetical protein